MLGALKGFTKSAYAVEHNGIVTPAAFGTIEGYRFPNAIKAVKNVGLGLAIAGTSLDIANTWTADTGNTYQQRMMKTAVHTSEFVGSLAVGALSVGAFTLAAAVTSFTGPGSILAGSVAALATSYAGNTVIDKLSDAVLDLHGIAR